MSAPVPAPRFPRAALAVAAVFCAVLLFGVGPRHTVPVPYEYDDYHGVAAALLRGELQPDPYHTFLHPLLAAAMAPLAGGPFAASRVVSTFAGALALLAAAAFATQLRGPRAGVAAAALLAVHPWFVTFALLSSSDLLATACGLASLAALARWRAGGGAGLLLAAAAGAGLAAAARYALLPLVAVVAVAAVWPRPGAPRAAVAGLLRTAVGAALGYLPHGLCAARCYGNPFHNLGWQNMVVKALHGWDTFAHDPAAHPRLLPFLREHGAAVAAAAWPDLGAIAQRELPALLTGWWLPAGAALAASGIAVVLVLLAARAAPFVPAAAFGLLHTLLVAATFRADLRVLLPLLPLAVIAAVALPWGALPRRLPHAAFAAALAGLAVALPLRLGALFAEEPHAEIAVARDLPRRLGHPPELATTYLLMRQQVPFRCHYLVQPGGATAPALHWQRLRDVGGKLGSDVFLIGRRTAPAQYAALTAGPVPADFTVLQRDDDLLLLAYAHPGSPGVAAATVAAVSGELHFTLTAGPAIDPADVVVAGFLARGAGDQPPLPLRAAGDRRFEFRCPSAAVAAREFVPFLLLRDGSVQRGTTVQISPR